MPAMTKRVNVRTVVAVRTVNPPISGTVNNVIMSTSDIMKCLCRRAIVDEILPGGKTVRLNMRNYYLDNGAGLDAYHPVQDAAKSESITTEVKQQNSTDIKFNANIVPPLQEEEAPAEESKEEITIEQEKTEDLSDPEAEKPEETVVETTSENAESIENPEEQASETHNENQAEESTTETLVEDSKDESETAEGKSTNNSNSSKKSKKK